jgi:hypothetical protein
MNEQAAVQLNVGDLLNRAWQVTKNNAGVLIGGYAIIFGVTIAFSVMQNIVQTLVMHGHNPPTMELMLKSLVYSSPIVLMSTVVSIFLTFGYMRLCLMALRDQNPGLSELVAIRPSLVPFFLASILVSIALCIGFMFCIVPGIYLMCALGLFGFIIIDRDGQLGAVAALQESWRLTDGYRGFIFLWFLVMTGVVCVGFLACCVGIIVAAPIGFVGWAAIFEALKQAKGVPQ